MPLINCDFNTDLPGILPSVCVKVKVKGIFVVCWYYLLYYCTYKGMFLFKGANGPIIKRSCGYEFAPNDNNCTSRYIPFFEKPEICEKCKSDGCNSANIYKIANISFVVIGVVYIFIK